MPRRSCRARTMLRNVEPASRTNAGTLPTFPSKRCEHELLPTARLAISQQQPGGPLNVPLGPLPSVIACGDGLACLNSRMHRVRDAACIQQYPSTIAGQTSPSTGNISHPCPQHLVVGDPFPSFCPAQCKSPRRSARALGSPHPQDMSLFRSPRHPTNHSTQSSAALSRYIHLLLLF